MVVGKRVKCTCNFMNRPADKTFEGECKIGTQMYLRIVRLKSHWELNVVKTVVRLENSGRRTS
jgi:hypothetical protein